MSAEVLELLNAILDISPAAMVFLISLAAIVVVGMALFVVLAMKQK